MRDMELAKVDLSAGHSDLENWAGNWIWRAVHCLANSTDFNPSPKWIAQRLNITVENAVDALEGLERLKMIERNGSTFKVVTDWVKLGPSEIDRRHLLFQHSKIALQLITKLKAHDKYGCEILLGKKELISKYGSRFKALYNEMREEGVRSGGTDVIASEVSFMVLTGTEGQRGEQ